MQETIYTDAFVEAAAEAAKKATEALQKLISPETRVIVADVERFEKPEETDAKVLAERCIDYYKQGKVIVASDIKIYHKDGAKKRAGTMLMFLQKEDLRVIENLVLENLVTEEKRSSRGMEESAIAETLNIIGNAYIGIISEVYASTIMSMVPKIIDATSFDGFIGEMASESKGKTYIMFHTELIITEQVIKIPFLLAVALVLP